MYIRAVQPFFAGGSISNFLKISRTSHGLPVRIRVAFTHKQASKQYVVVVSRDNVGEGLCSFFVLVTGFPE